MKSNAIARKKIVHLVMLNQIGDHYEVTFCRSKYIDPTKRTKYTSYRNITAASRDRLNNLSTVTHHVSFMLFSNWSTIYIRTMRDHLYFRQEL